MTIEQYPIVLVEWVDASSWEDWSDDLDQYQLLTVHTAGHLLREDSRMLVLAQNIADPGGEHETHSMVMAIPATCVVRLTQLWSGWGDKP